MTSKNSLRLLTALTVYTCYVSACCTITVRLCGARSMFFLTRHYLVFYVLYTVVALWCVVNLYTGPQNMFICA